jgi:hypothetical protein
MNCLSEGEGWERERELAAAANYFDKKKRRDIELYVCCEKDRERF